MKFQQIWSFKYTLSNFLSHSGPPPESEYLLPIFHKSLCLRVNKCHLDYHSQIFVLPMEHFVATLLDGSGGPATK